LKVVILCAGRGSRLGSMTDYIPKAMVTINRKPVISYILDQIYDKSAFTEEVKTAIAVGYCSEVLKSYVSDFYQDKDITFIDVEKYQGTGSGPGYSLLQTATFVAGEPFILILGDTLCFQDLSTFVDKNASVIGIYDVENPARFTTCDIDRDGYIKGFYDKQENAPSRKAIVGIYYIKDSKTFFEGLDKTRNNLIKEELQISNGLLFLLQNGKKIKAQPTTWLDAGIKETLAFARNCLGDYDTIYKNNSLTIIQDDRVRKYGFDSYIEDFICYFKAIQKMPAAKLYDEVIYISETPPLYLDFKADVSNDQKLTLIFLRSPVSNEKALDIIRNVLEGFKKYLHSSQKPDVSPEDIDYEYKTHILQKLENDETLKPFLTAETIKLNGLQIANPYLILKNMDTKQLLPPLYTHIHGNVYLGNIIYNLAKDSFKLIYPRMWFGNSFIYGDYTLDLAMLRQCFNGKYNLIKANRFKLEQKSCCDYIMEVETTAVVDYVQNAFDSIIRDLYPDDDTLIYRVRLLEGILFLYNATNTNKAEMKLAFYLMAGHLLNAMRYLHVKNGKK